MEVFKEEKSKTKLERVLSKSKVKGETSKSTEKVTQPGKVREKPTKAVSISSTGDIFISFPTLLA